MTHRFSRPLRGPAGGRTFHIVLVEPEIPPNTGNIARICAATRSTLHLVGQLGFRIDEHAVRRAGLDYWHLVDVLVHQDLASAEARCAELGPATSPRVWLMSGKGERSYLDVRFELGDVLVFGKESVGLEVGLLEARPESVIAIPTLGAVRSLNLANAVAVTVFEALRQIGALSPVSA